MGSIADMGGVLGYGPASQPVAGEPPFAEPWEPWEGRAFALTVLTIEVWDSSAASTPVGSPTRSSARG